MSASASHAEKRIALVIGNATYQNTPALSNPVNDGEDLAAALRRVGFTVVLERNLNKRGMEGAIARFARMSQDANTALFFYAGHGMQWRGINYLVPVDARMEDEFNLNFELTRLDDVLFGLERAKGVKILVLDACRNNPLLDRLNRTSSTRDLMATRGFAKIETSRGMVIAYSTQINQVAVDGTGRNSPFTQALVKEIDEPGLEIGTMFRRVAAQVNKMTEGRQLPELSVSLLGEFYLNSRETDLQTWAKIRTSSDPGQLKDFIARYPTSDLLANAQQRLDSIERAEKMRVDRERSERERVERAERNRIESDRLTREQAEREQARTNDETEGKTIPEIPSTDAQIAMLTQPAESPPAATTTQKAFYIPSQLRCTAFSANPVKRPSFETEFSFRYFNGSLTAKRIIRRRPGAEIYEGTVGQTGAIRIKSHGTYDDGRSSWVSVFSGQVGSRTVLEGRLSTTKGLKGIRICSITFKMPSSELRSVLGLLDANFPKIDKDSINKPRRE
ncbi:MAG: caspase domain-containing protein [Pseudorhodoplanes sp.]|nr:caspase domain-containing protein [Pseudorhodoplanes sp.]